MPHLVAKIFFTRLSFHFRMVDVCQRQPYRQPANHHRSPWCAPRTMHLRMPQIWKSRAILHPPAHWTCLFSFRKTVWIPPTIMRNGCFASAWSGGSEVMDRTVTRGVDESSGYCPLGIPAACTRDLHLTSSLKPWTVISKIKTPIYPGWKHLALKANTAPCDQ